ncbi:MAG: hypothetical protein BWK79_16225 [Beggiatoa sp. IS2]|nr:MAG: hypothetical protein BWK79_16225 [Beggiatoa sp. IS2]
MDLENDKAFAKGHITNHINALNQIATNELQTIVSDLLFLSEHSVEYQEHRIDHHSSEPLFEAEAKYYIAFSKNRKIYDQIRFLTTNGVTTLQINYNQGHPEKLSKLDFELNSAEFAEMNKLEVGEIYYSSFKLSMQQEMIEHPFKPIIQFGVPIFKENQKMGILLVNYLGNSFLKYFDQILADAPGELMLLNSEGFWIKSSRPEDEWGFILKCRAHRQFQTDFPEEWQHIANHQSGQFFNDKGLFTFSTIYPHLYTQRSAQLETTISNSAEVGQHHWKIVSYIPPTILYANSRKFFNRLIIIYIPLMIAIGIGCLILSFINRRRKLAERRLKEQYISYARFVPEEFLKLLNKNRLTDIRLADHIQQEITLFFSDIRSYTQLSESMSPKETFHFLNTYFKEVDPVIQKNSGFIDKFIGDAIMAIFPQSPLDALSSVIEIKHQLDIYNEGRKNAGYSAIQVGFGLHCGEVTLGTVGTLHRMQTTVIGDTVNLASRIESLTKVFKVDIILSDCVYDRLPDNHHFNIREIDTVRVRGKQTPVILYEAFDTNSLATIARKQQGLPLFRQAITDYKAGHFKEAMDLFSQCQALCPEDSIPPIYIKRCNALLRVPPGPDWAGISTL